MMAERTLSDLVLNNKPRADRLVGGTRAAIGQGLMMGWGDEGEAWLRSKLGDEDYEDAVKRIRQEYGQYSEENPLISTAAEFGGGVIPGVAAMFVPGAQGAGAAQIARAGGSTLTRLAARPIVRTIATGAVEGGIAGAGSAEEGNRGTGAAVGTILGGGLGAAIPLSVRTAGGLKDWASQRLFPSAKKAEEAAARKMAEAMGESDLTTQQIQQKMLEDKAMGIPSTIANVDPALADLAETVAQRTGKGTREVEKTINQQQAGAKERTYQQVRKGLNSGQFYDEEQKLLEDLRTKSEPAYKRAYDVGEVDDPQIMEMLNLPQFRNSWKIARQIANDVAAAAKAKAIAAGDEFDPSEFELKKIFKVVRDEKGRLRTVQTGNVPDVRTLDYMKRAMDAQVNAAYLSDNAAVKASAGAYKDLRNALRDRTKDVVPEYKDALQTYKGDKEILEALQSGYNDFGKLDHEQVIRMVADMSPAEKIAFRTGVVRDLYGKMFGTSRNINAAGLLEAPETLAKLQPLFDSPAQMQLFRAAVERESQLFKQANQMLRGSQTGKRTAMREKFEDAGEGVTQATLQALTGGWLSSLSGMASRALYKTSMTDEMSEKLAKMLMSREPQDVAAAVRILDDYAAQAAPKAARATALELGLVGGTAISRPKAPSSEKKQKSIDEPDELLDVPKLDIEARE